MSVRWNIQNYLGNGFCDDEGCEDDVNDDYDPYDDMDDDNFVEYEDAKMKIPRQALIVGSVPYKKCMSLQYQNAIKNGSYISWPQFQKEFKGLCDHLRIKQLKRENDINDDYDPYDDMDNDNFIEDVKMNIPPSALNVGSVPYKRCMSMQYQHAKKNGSNITWLQFQKEFKGLCDHLRKTKMQPKTKMQSKTKIPFMTCMKEKYKNRKNTAEKWNMYLKNKKELCNPTSAITVAQLKKWASQYGLVGYSKMLKAELLKNYKKYNK
jgi:hypothetical protein